MKRLWFYPIVYFIFGIIVFALESFMFNSMTDVSIETRVLVNNINKGTFILIPILMLTFTLVTKLNIFRKLTTRSIFVLYSVVLYILISYFWIITIQWK